jgi:hypothetical protein
MIKSNLTVFARMPAETHVSPQHEKYGAAKEGWRVFLRDESNETEWRRKTNGVLLPESAAITSKARRRSNQWREL